MKLELFDQTLFFDKDASFSQDFVSPVTGKLFTAITLPGEEILTISFPGKKPGKPKATKAEAEGVIQIALLERPWNVEIDSSSATTFISLPGHRPGIESGGQPSTPVTPAAEIRLQADHGRWQVSPDATGQFLNVSFREIGMG
jgi:hypothetical protein